MNVSSYAERLEATFSTGNPEVRTWFLVRNNYLPVIFCILYALIVKVIGPYLMKHRKPFNLRSVMICYNLLVVAIYSYCTLNGLHYLIFTYRKSLCGTVEITRHDRIYEMAVYIWCLYLMKYVEFIDTIFLVLRKKNQRITNLHVIHHFIFPILVWTFLRTETSTFYIYPGIINSIVHMVMYSYYGVAAIGPEMRRYLWWKRYLTIMQMTQFAVVVVLVTVVKPLAGCESRDLSTKIAIVGNIFFFMMFYNFYRKSFKKTPRKINAD